MPAEVVGEADRPPRALTRSACERLVLQLLGDGVLCDDFHFTAYSVVHYAVTGARAHALERGDLARVLFQVRESEAEAVAGEMPSIAMSAAAQRKKEANSKGAGGAAGGAASSCGGGGGGSSCGSSSSGKKRRRSMTAGGSGGSGGGSVAVQRPTGASGFGVVDLCDSEDDEVVCQRGEAVVGEPSAGQTRAGESEQEAEEEEEEEEGWSDNDSDDFQPTKPTRTKKKNVAAREGTSGSDA